ncbi:TPA: hypothetical protein ROX88_003897 [Bacillus pseudomycoides]|nr:hypothetical protein [Bacillus pseudomycoides]
MKKRLSRFLGCFFVFFVLFNASLIEVNAAGFQDNPPGVYHRLSSLVYKVNGSTENLNDLQYKLNNSNLGQAGKYVIIDTIDVNENRYHPMATNKSGEINKLDATGFKAMAVVVPSSKKLFIAIAGSENIYDFNAAKNVIENDNPGQISHAQLYTNYIYKNFPQYASYDWYLTGHSLGGWLATKLYLDLRSANWLVSGPNWKYGGEIKKSISGVYTFNTLPIKEGSVPDKQWDENKKGLYNKAIKNLYISNEWLNRFQKLHSKKFNYFGTKGSIDKGISDEFSSVSGTLAEDLIHLATIDRFREAHGLCQLSPHVFPKGDACTP